MVSSCSLSWPEGLGRGVSGKRELECEAAGWKLRSRFKLREVQKSQVVQGRENRWCGRKMMTTGKGHGRVAAEGNYVLVFFLALSEFGLEMVELLPTTLFQIFLSAGNTMQKFVTDPYLLLYHYVESITKTKQQ